ncbi:transposase [Kutzneria sp. 744]|nr:transposase [Kutzneria sp. 744]
MHANQAPDLHEPLQKAKADGWRTAFPLWVADVEPGSMHDLTLAREHLLGALHWAASQLELPTPADGSYEGSGIGVHTTLQQPAGDQVLDVDNVPTTRSSADCAAWVNAALRYSPAAGAPSTTSPPAPARSATSSKPHSFSPMSNTTDSADVGAITSLCWGDWPQANVLATAPTRTGSTTSLGKPSKWSASIRLSARTVSNACAADPRSLALPHDRDQRAS